MKSACSGMNCLGICYEESWNEVKSILEKLHRLVGRPKRNLKTLTECFKEAKNRAFSLSAYLLTLFRPGGGGGGGFWSPGQL